MGSTKDVKLSTWRATSLHSVDITLIKHIWYSYTNHLGLFENYMVCGAGLEINSLGLWPSSNTLQSLTHLGYGPINLKLGVFN